MITEIVTPQEIARSVIVISASFATVARDFNLTIDNCPTNAAFVTREQLKVLHEKGQKFYGLYENGKQAGFVAMERGDKGVYYMEKLAVMPDARHKGYGEQLVHHIAEHARNGGGDKLGIGIIDENKVLKEWYKGLGFVETGTKLFPHLPFTVCFMEMALR